MSPEKELEPYYEDGQTEIEHSNVDASGDSHPFGDEPKEWKADLRPLIREFADDMYDSWEATVREYLANAETACRKVERFNEDPSSLPYDDMTVDDSYEPRITVTWDKSKHKLIIQDNGIGMAAVEVDQVFRHIGRSAARDLGTMVGAFGIGALSFLKFIGVDNASMITLTNSRLNGDNAAYLVSLAGIEPIRGSLGDAEYGTKFKLDQKKDDMDIRSAVEKYAEWMRVPVLYRELDENGTEVFNEDWGDKQLYDDYSNDAYMDKLVEPGLFEAYMSDEADDRTLLLSMQIERGTTSSPIYPVDVRILDESGKVCVSTNGNKGLTPVVRPEYEKMLLDARPNHITEDLLSSHDVTAFETTGDEYDYAIEQSVLDSDEALPVADYVPLSEGDDRLIGDKVVLIGPHSGRTVVSQDEWDELPEGRAESFVIEGELEEFDVDSGTGDLCLPKPTTDRSSLQDAPKFWKYIATYFDDEFQDLIEDYRDMFKETDDQMKAIQEAEPQTVETMVNTDA